MGVTDGVTVRVLLGVLLGVPEGDGDLEGVFVLLADGVLLGVLDGVADGERDLEGVSVLLVVREGAPVVARGLPDMVPQRVTDTHLVKDRVVVLQWVWAGEAVRDAPLVVARGDGVVEAHWVGSRMDWVELRVGVEDAERQRLGVGEMVPGERDKVRDTVGVREWEGERERV